MKKVTISSYEDCLNLLVKTFDSAIKYAQSNNVIPRNNEETEKVLLFVIAKAILSKKKGEHGIIFRQASSILSHEHGIDIEDRVSERDFLRVLCKKSTCLSKEHEELAKLKALPFPLAIKGSVYTVTDIELENPFPINSSKGLTFDLRITCLETGGNVSHSYHAFEEIPEELDEDSPEFEQWREKIINSQF
jgi:hypothetical protein